MIDVKAPRLRNIAELARLAGVSTGTVSRALAGSTLVKPDTRARIVALAAAHDFRPNQMAQRLRNQRTGVIGIVVPLGHEQRQHLSDPFFMTMLGFLADALTESGHDLMLSRAIPNAADWLDRIVDSGMLDGVLLIGQSDQHDAIERVAARYRPLVVWGTASPGQRHCAIGSDNLAGGRMAAGRLIASGKRRLAFLGESHTPEVSLRHAGVVAATADAGLPPPLLLPTHFAHDGMADEVAAHIDAAGHAIDGIVAASDVIAMTVLRVLADRAIAVPGRIAVIGYDDVPLAAAAVPRITTIRQDIGRGAQAMVEALFARIAGHDTTSLQMAPELVIRDSG